VNPRRIAAACLLLLLSCTVLLVVYVCLGTRLLSPLDILSGSLPDRDALVAAFRLKRGLLALAVGGSLALAGAAFQALLRNPLADPFVVGVSGGAAIGGTLVMVLLASAAPLLSVLFYSLSVFVGAFLASVVFAALLYRLSSTRGVIVTNSLLLMGVVFNFFASAVVLFLKTVLQGTKLQEVLFWLMGSLAVETLPSGVLAVAGVAVVAACLALVLLSPRVNLVSVSEEFSAGSGVEPERVKRQLFLLASVLVAVAVSVAGFIGFVGLIVPHAVRIVAGADHRALFPLSTLAGALFLLAADLLARLSLPLSGTALPVGVVTAFVGGPLFIALLARAQNRGELA